MMSEERDVQKLTEEELDGVVGGQQYYIIKKGDTLVSIAEKFHTSVDVLVKLNHVTNPNYLVVGQKFRIS